MLLPGIQRLPRASGLALALALALVLVLSLTPAPALALAGTVAVALRRNAPTASLSTASLFRRDAASTIQLTLINNITKGSYSAQIGVGTPPQNLTFQLDTGSSDTWVSSLDSDSCTSSRLQRQQDVWCPPQFAPNASSTFALVDEGGFNITYLDNKNARGDYFSDSLTINGHTVRDQKMGLALSSTLSTGIMGLGFDDNVVSRLPYPTFVDNMIQSGLIQAPVFSLFLDGLDASSGSILFGGIDSDKFHGNLTTLPLASYPEVRPGEARPGKARPGKGTEYAVNLRALDVDGLHLGEIDTAAILDSGSSLCLLPHHQVHQIYKHFDVHSEQVDKFAIPLIDCAYRDSKGRGITFKFRFDGASIYVPMREMVIDFFPDDVQQEISSSKDGPLFNQWKRVCLFGIASAAHYGIAPNSFALLGVPFLRSAYVVYDMANRQIGIAQANAKSNKSNIVAVSKGATQLPDVVGVPGTGQDSPAERLHPLALGAAAGSLFLMAVIFITTFA